uniref:Uncharacterized protein n=1 Tax=Schizaphis graminum TaxID=13262 RepID=A0A2S2NL52_SCHGA
MCLSTLIYFYVFNCVPEIFKIKLVAVNVKNRLSSQYLSQFSNKLSIDNLFYFLPAHKRVTHFCVISVHIVYFKLTVHVRFFLFTIHTTGFHSKITHILREQIFVSKFEKI